MKSQKGFAHIIIIVVVAAALVAVLGYVFWKNFIQTDTKNQNVAISQNDAETKEKAQDQDSTDSSTIPDGWEKKSIDGLGVTFAVPEDWSEVSVEKYKIDENVPAVNSGVMMYLRYSDASKSLDLLVDNNDGAGPQKSENNLSKQSTVKAEDEYVTFFYESLHTGSSETKVIVVKDSSVYQFALGKLMATDSISDFIGSISFDA